MLKLMRNEINVSGYITLSYKKQTKVMQTKRKYLKQIAIKEVFKMFNN